METLRAFVRQRPVLSFFIVTCAISWGSILIAMTQIGFPGSPDQAAFAIALVLNEAGPLVAGLLLAALVYGWRGVRDLIARLLKWRVGIGWYAVAILTVPLLVAPILFVLARISPAYLPGIVTTTDKVSLILMGIGVGIFGGIFEEIGWTGFATPELRRRAGILTTGLIIGLVWGVWHIPITFWASGDAAGVFSWALFLPPVVFYLLTLPVYRVIMVWVYQHTKSVLVAVLMHVSLIASTLFVLLPPATGLALALYYVVLTVILWGLVAAIGIGSRGEITRRPLSGLRGAAGR